MLVDIDKIPPFERMQILAVKRSVENNGWLNQTQKTVIEQKLQEIVKVWVSKNFV